MMKLDAGGSIEWVEYRGPHYGVEKPPVSSLAWSASTNELLGLGDDDLQLTVTSFSAADGRMNWKDQCGVVWTSPGQYYVGNGLAVVEMDGIVYMGCRVCNLAVSMPPREPSLENAGLG